MGFFEKVKNMFTEEVEDDDVKVEQIKKEVTKVAIESPNAKNDKEEDFVDNFEFKSEEKISAPVFFDDNDFRDLNLNDKKEDVKVEVKEKVMYGSKIQEPVEEKKNFKPTPIISPVYGILDKNYHKEDIVSRHEVKNFEKESNESSIDAIRNKAYGTLEDELENTLFGSNSILFKKEEESKEKLEIEEVNDDILTDLTDDISKELDELLIKKEKYIDEEDSKDIEDSEDVVEKKKSDINDEDLLEFIDSTLYKDGDEE